MVWLFLNNIFGILDQRIEQPSQWFTRKIVSVNELHCGQVDISTCIFSLRYYLFQRQTNFEEGLQIRKQIRQTPKESSGVQLQKSTESSEEKGVHLGRRRQRSTFMFLPYYFINIVLFYTYILYIYNIYIYVCVCIYVYKQTILHIQ